MKKILAAIGLLVIIGIGIAVWLLRGSATAFEGKYKYLYIPTVGANRSTVLSLLDRDSLVKHPALFDRLATRMGYWKQIKPGKYRINAGDNIIDILRRLRNGSQTPVNLVITKLRTRENLAALVGKRFECDSASFMQFLLNHDTLSKYQLDTNTVMTAVLPDTYTFFWNTTPSRIFQKLYGQYLKFWTPENKELAEERGLTPQTAYTLASIVEEETNKNDEKGYIASVYLNRIRIGMRLGADPTVKYALRDFGLKRIYQKHLAVESPYNTYRITGLPPGPICTPSVITLDAVLKAPKTDYIYFVAKSDFSGYHQFTTSYREHLKYARMYRKALDSLILRRAQKARDTQ